MTTTAPMAPQQPKRRKQSKPKIVVTPVRREQVDIDKLVQGLLLLVEQRNQELQAELRDLVS